MQNIHKRVQKFFWKDLLLKGLPIILASKMLCKWVNYGINQAITQKFNEKAQKVS